MSESITVTTAVPTDLRYVVSLMRANRESVGGLPAPAIEERIARGTLLLSVVDGDPVGYLMYDFRAGVLRIPQACIQYDARRRKYGEVLVAEMLRRHAAAIQEVTVRCAADLEANVFWRDMGFTCVGNVPGGKRRGRSINLWVMWLVKRLVALPELARSPVIEMRQDSMYDDSGYSSSGRLLPKMAWANRKPLATDTQLVLPE